MPFTEARTDTPAPPVLDVRGLRVVFPHRRRPVVAVDGVSFTIERGTALGLVGESGSGKTTTGRAVLRLIEPSSGTVRLGGVDITAADAPTLRRLRAKAQIVFQDPAGSLNPRHRLWRTITEPRALQGLSRGRGPLRDVAAGLAEAVGLDVSILDRYPHQLSGGQRQRVAIARALSVEPELIVCDEPTSALDVSIQAQVINLLMDLQRRRGLAYLFISHDIAVVRHVCPAIAVMKDGRIVEHGPREQIINAPQHPYTRWLIAAVPRRPRTGPD